MELEKWAEKILPDVEHAMQEVINLTSGFPFSGLHAMLTYHMGWEGEGSGLEARGKRIRPLLVALACSAAGGDWRHALPAATAVELLHNFSLIHDDIEDNSPLRHNRLTVWKLWGIPQAINTGDALFTLAHISILNLAKFVQAETTLKAAQLLQETCLSLTQGQYLDISFETKTMVSLDEYWEMIKGKTSGLLSACVGLGALVANAEESTYSAYRLFGEKLGLAFQVRDDILGIWGNAKQTGKSTKSDLITGKKTLPVLFGLEQNKDFARQWRQGFLSPEEISTLAKQLEAEGGRSYAEEQAERLTHEAIQALAQTNPKGTAGVALTELATNLLRRPI